MLVLLTADHFDELQARRHEWGADKWDEVWDRIPHLRPVGSRSDLQQSIALLLRDAASERGLVPVLGAFEAYHPDSHSSSEGGEPRLRGDQAATAAVAVDIIGRDDDRRQRLSLLASDQVEEVVIVDLEDRRVDWLALVDTTYKPVAQSRLIGLSPVTLATMIAWPADA